MKFRIALLLGLLPAFGHAQFSPPGSDRHKAEMNVVKVSGDAWRIYKKGGWNELANESRACFTKVAPGDQARFSYCHILLRAALTIDLNNAKVEKRPARTSTYTTPDQGASEINSAMARSGISNGDAIRNIGGGNGPYAIRQGLKEAGMPEPIALLEF